MLIICTYFFFVTGSFESPDSSTKKKIFLFALRLEIFRPLKTFFKTLKIICNFLEETEKICNGSISTSIQVKQLEYLSGERAYSIFSMQIRIYLMWDIADEHWMPLMRCLRYLHEYETTKSAEDEHSDIIFLGLYSDNVKKNSQ